MFFEEEEQVQNRFNIGSIEPLSDDEEDEDLDNDNIDNW
jgi:hypothetical protein